MGAAGWGGAARGAETVHEKPAELIAQARVLFEKGSWDASQDIYHRAAVSPRIEDRIRAYEGLVELYSKLKMTKKAAGVKAALENEKALLLRLVPTDPSFYRKIKVKKGDSYARVAAREKVSRKWLEMANAGRTIRAGEEILVPDRPFYLVVRKDERKLYWWRGAEEILKVYPVSIGRKETQTPEGEYRVIEKVEDPVWYREGKIISAGDPKNLLGTRWMGLDVKGYGIHGTRYPGSIGNAVSHGCVRMLNRDVEELFEWVPVGTVVVIQSS